MNMVFFYTKYVMPEIQKSNWCIIGDTFFDFYKSEKMTHPFWKCSFYSNVKRTHGYTPHLANTSGLVKPCFFSWNVALRLNIVSKPKTKILLAGFGCDPQVLDHTVTIFANLSIKSFESCNELYSTCCKYWFYLIFYIEMFSINPLKSRDFVIFDLCMICNIILYNRNWYIIIL